MSNWVAIYLNKDEMEVLNRICEEERCSKYAFVKSLIQDALKNWKEEKGDVGKNRLEKGHEGIAESVERGPEQVRDEDKRSGKKGLTPFL